MKKGLLVKCMVLMTAVMLLNSCKDGADGRVYLNIKDPTLYCYYYTSYWDNNSGIPYSFTYGRNYSCSAGTYNYDYYVSSTCGYQAYECTGTYTLSQNKGSQWNAIKDGV